MYCVRKHLQQWFYTPHHKINSYPITFALASVNLMQFQLDLGGFSFVSSVRLPQQGRKPGWFGWAAQGKPWLPTHGHCPCPRELPTLQGQNSESRENPQPSTHKWVWYRKTAGKKARILPFHCFNQRKRIKKHKRAKITIYIRVL